MTQARDITLHEYRKRIRARYAATHGPTLYSAACLMCSQWIVTQSRLPERCDICRSVHEVEMRHARRARPHAKEYARQYNQSNRLRISENQRQRRALHRATSSPEQLKLERARAAALSRSRYHKSHPPVLYAAACLWCGAWMTFFLTAGGWRTTWCPDCRDRVGLEQERALRAANPERYRSRQRQWMKKNRDRVNALGRSWYAANRDQIRARKNRWYADNRAKVAVNKLATRRRARAIAGVNRKLSNALGKEAK